MKTDNMTAKEYLEQARTLDRAIDAKLVQLDALRSLSTRTSAILSHLPRPASGNHKSFEDTVVRIVTMEQVIDAAVDRLVLLKQEITDYLELLPDVECQRILAHRYLEYKSWKEISSVMAFSGRYTYKLHDKALELLEAILPAEKRTRSAQEDDVL